MIHVLDVEASIVKSDLDESDVFSSTLIQAVEHLENVPDSRKDWHPGSDGLVLDLVHPSLCPLQYGKSMVLPNDKIGLSNWGKYVCEGKVCPLQPELNEGLSYDRKGSWGNNLTLRPWGNYQWLPSEVRFREDGTATIESYINNLHPQQRSELYSVLEKAVDEALPLWNECLSFFHTRMRINVEGVGLASLRILRRG